MISFANIIENLPRSNTVSPLIWTRSRIGFAIDRSIVSGRSYRLYCKGSPHVARYLVRSRFSRSMVVSPITSSVVIRSQSLTRIIKSLAIGIIVFNSNNLRERRSIPYRKRDGRRSAHFPNFGLVELGTRSSRLSILVLPNWISMYGSDVPLESLGWRSMPRMT